MESSEKVSEPLLETLEKIGPEVAEIMPDSTYESFDEENPILDSIDEAQEEPTDLDTEEIREMSKTAVIEEKSGEIIPGSDIRVEEDRVVGEIQKGYFFGEKLYRPTKVIVSQNPCQK